MTSLLEADPIFEPPTLVEKDEKKGFVKRMMKDIFPPKKPSPFNLDTTDAVAIVFFAAIGVITRVFRIQFPPTTVFDEVHFGNFTNWYLRGQYFHDIHPPLGKLIHAVIANFAGYKGDYSFELLEGKKYPSMTYVALRLTPAFFGALCIPLSYLIVRAAYGNHFAASFAAILTACDLMLVIEARHILIDSVLHFFSCLAVFSIFLDERLENVVTFIFECVCLGLVASCKYTSGGIILLALYRQFRDMNLKDIRFNPPIRPIARSILIIFTVSFIHYIMFSIHLSALPYYPENKENIPKCIEDSLVDRMNPDWEKRNNAPSMLRRIITLVLHMHFSNMNVGHSHPYASPWWSWPLFMRKWLLFWTSEGKHLICFGNLFIWYPVFIGVIWNLIRNYIFKQIDSQSYSMLFGYIFSFLPFVLIPRDTFIYHYSIPLLFGIWGLSLSIQNMDNPKIRGFLFSSLILAAII